MFRYLLLSLLISCRSEVTIKNKEPTAPSGFYSFGAPSVYEASSSDSFTITMDFDEGLLEIEPQFLKLKSTGNSSCQYEVDNLFTQSPTITLSSCNGNGRV